MICKNQFSIIFPRGVLWVSTAEGLRAGRLFLPGLPGPVYRVIQGCKPAPTRLFPCSLFSILDIIHADPLDVVMTYTQPAAAIFQ